MKDECLKTRKEVIRTKKYIYCITKQDITIYSIYYTVEL